MKQLFAIFVAVVLMPTLNTYAWIGGPFSNNSFFDKEGDDGAYEATATTVNGVGIYRFGVQNNFDGFTDDTVPTVTVRTFNIFGDVVSEREVISVSSGNLQFGGFGGVTHTWFVEGVSYFGDCFGSVNSISGTVFATGFALQGAVFNPAPAYGTGTDSVSSGFNGILLKSGKDGGAATNRFSGRGQLTISTDPAGDPPRNFVVFGSRYSTKVTYGI